MRLVILEVLSNPLLWGWGHSGDLTADFAPVAAQLGASPHHKESLAMSSFGGSTFLNNQVSLVNFILETTEGDIKISALVVPKIAAPIQNFVRSDLHNLPHLRGLTLAHPVSSAEKFEISLLIGVDYYWEIVGNHIVRRRGPTAMQSKLGYLLSGPLPVQSEQLLVCFTPTQRKHLTLKCLIIQTRS